MDRILGARCRFRDVYERAQRAHSFIRALVASP